MSGGRRRFEIRQQVAHRAAGQRIDQFGGDRGKRLEDEAALPKPGMRQVKVRLADHQIAHQDEIEVKGPRGPRVRPLAAALPFDPQQGGQQPHRRLSAQPHRGAVQEPGLRAHADRIGLQERRHPHVRQQRAERRNREGQVGAPAPQVAPERDGGEAEIGPGAGARRRYDCCFSLHVMHTRVQGIAFSRAGAIGSPQSRQMPYVP